MNEAIKYDLEFYEQHNEYPSNVYLVVIYKELGSPIDFSVYHERDIAEQEAMRQTRATHIVEAAKDSTALTYAIGEELMAEIHEKVLI